MYRFYAYKHPENRVFSSLKKVFGKGVNKCIFALLIKTNQLINILYKNHEKNHFKFRISYGCSFCSFL